MRFFYLMTAVAWFASGMVAEAADRKFPYEAMVDVEEGENVRSGPGPKYYPTTKLRKGDRVMVHRHDPGGWCMIVPPAGSFSWVRAEYIQKSGAETGVLKTSGVVVHVGSAINPEEFTTVQANLSQGDAVEILGEKNFTFEDGPRLMYKITPVKREWRWIARKSIVAADAVKSDPFPAEQTAPKKRNGPVAQLDEDAFAKPVSMGPAHRPEDSSSTEKSRSTTAGDLAVRPSGPGSDLPAAARQQLEEIDQHFREMIRQDKSTWDLDSLENLYRDLEDEVGEAAMTSLIAQRQDAVQRYRKTQQDYLEFFKLSAETKQRDAQLQSPRTSPERSPVAGQVPAAGNGPQSRVPVSAPHQPAAPQQPAVTQQPSVPKPAPAQAGGAPAFDGAGIVQKMAQTFPGGPQFVLITPDGRMLSFLQPGPGVDLNRHVGRAMGIMGQRVHRDDWNADMITVRSLHPVQLRGSR